jgi:hypothetical protein
VRTFEQTNRCSNNYTSENVNDYNSIDRCRLLATAGTGPNPIKFRMPLNNPPIPPPCSDGLIADENRLLPELEAMGDGGMNE